MWVTVTLKANHKLTRLKRFVSPFQTNCVINLFFYLYLMFYVCFQRFDEMDENFLDGELNRALISWALLVARTCTPVGDTFLSARVHCDMCFAWLVRYVLQVLVDLTGQGTMHLHCKRPIRFLFFLCAIDPSQTCVQCKEMLPDEGSQGPCLVDKIFQNSSSH